MSFADLTTISETSAFRIVGAFDPSRDRRVTLVVVQPTADRTLAAAALTRLYEAHREPAHSDIARAVAHVRAPSEADEEFVIFDFPARLDLERVVQTAAEAGWRTELDSADGFTNALRDALVADQTAPAPRCLGTLGLGNVLFAADGRHAVIGYGHNIVCVDEHGRLVARGRFFQAPEIMAGAPATPASDYVGMVKMSRTLLTFVRLPETLVRCLSGGTDADESLRKLLMRFEVEVTQSTPATRPPIPEMVALSRKIKSALGMRDDPEGFREDVARLVAKLRPDLLGPPKTIRLAYDTTWIAVDGVTTKISPLLRRLLRVLATTRLDRPGQVIRTDALIDAGWPDEKMSYASGRNRLHVALSGLRKLGLQDDIEFESGGYRLRPSLRIELED